MSRESQGPRWRSGGSLASGRSALAACSRTSSFTLARASINTGSETAGGCTAPSGPKHAHRPT